jgi:hypothetical protein
MAAGRGALLDGVIPVTGTLWFLSWLRRRWPTHGPLLGKAARASYATYVIHPRTNAGQAILGLLLR